MTAPAVDGRADGLDTQGARRSKVLRASRAVGIAVAFALPAVLVPGSPKFDPQFSWAADDPTMSLATFAIIFGIVALSFGSLMRLSGLPSIAHGALWGVGAYTAGALVVHLEWSFLATILPALVVPALVAAVIGVPAFRTSGVAFLVISIVLGEFLVLVITNADSLTGGPDGLLIVGTDLRAGPFDLAEVRDRYYVSLLFLYVAIVSIWLVARSRLGRRLEMIRDNEPLARSIGLDPLVYKLAIFMITAALAGAGGQLYLYHQQAIEADLFGVYAFIPIILAAVLGGMRWIAGPIVGAYIVAFLPTWFGNAGLDDPNTRTLVYGLLLVLVISVAPAGLVGLVVKAPRLLVGHRRRRTVTAPAVVSRPPPQLTAGAPSAPPPPDGQLVLQAKGLTKHFGAVRALEAVDVSVRVGEILGVIGPNGSGKTTLFNCISGFVPCEGSIVWSGRRIKSPSPQRLARTGLIRTFQQPAAFASMTARVACAQVLAVRRRVPGAAGLPADLESLLAFCGLASVADAPVESLSYGQRRMLGVALALAAHPSLLMLDEPAAGLNDHESQELRRLLESVRVAGVTLVVVDHDMTFLLPLCDRVVVLDAGRVVADGTPSEVTERPEVVAAYLGERFARSVDLVHE